jgi:N-acetylmuramoyl-L-alanine amidase
MATATLDEEIKRKRVEDALIASDDSDSDADASTDLPEDTDSSEEDKSSSPEAVYQPRTKAGPSYVLVPLNAPKLDTKTDEQVTGSALDLTNPNQLGATKLDTKTDEQVVAPPLDKGEAPAQLPQVEKAQPVLDTKTDEQVTAPGEAPAALSQVERATLVKLPAPDLGERGAPIPTAASVDTPDLSTDLPEDVSSVVGGTAQPEVRRAALAGETPVALPPEPVVRGAQVGVTPRAQPVTGGQGFYGGDLSQGPPGTKPDGTEDEPYWPKSAKDIALLPPGANYIDPSDQSQKVTPGTPPKVQRAQPVSSAAAPAAPAPRQTSLGLTPDEYKAQYVNPPTGTAAQPSVATPDASALNINTDYTADSNSSAKGRGGDGKISGIILHSTDAGEKSSRETLTHGGVSAHYLVTEDGRIYNLVSDEDTAYHAGKTTGQYAGYNNSNTIGIEQVHIDGQPWAPAQVAATARLVAHLKNKYGVVDDGILGHSDVAPGRKQDPLNFPWKGFFAAVDSSTSAAQPTGAAGGKTGQQAGVGPAITGKATTFGYNDPQDSGVGAPKLGQLDTNNRDLIGIAVPEEALRAYVGAHPQSWRTARVQVTGANGQQVMVPIVDLGPRDTSGNVVADFTQGLTDLTGNKGNQNFGFRIIPNAGPDVMKDPQAFADEQAAIKAGINTGARFQAQAAAVKKPSYVLQPMAPKSPQQQQAEQFAVQGQTDTLDELNRNTENPGQFWKTLQQPIQGVSDGARTAYADNFKQELTKYAQDFYGEKDPDKAFNRAVGDANLGTFGQDVGRAATGVIGQVDVGINKMSRDSDNNALDRFAQVLHPESDGPGRAAFIKTLTDIQDPNLRAQTIGKLWANLDPDKQASIDINGLVNSADNVANPAFQAGQAKEIAAKDAFIQKLFTPDPTLRGTAGAWATPIGQMVGNTAMAFMPKILQTSAFAAQLYGSTRDRIKEEHPDWTDEQIAQNSTISTFAQLAPQEALIAASHGIMGPIARWGANPVIRFGIGGGVHLATGAAGGALMQAGANIAEGQPIGEGVPEAAGQGAIQAAPFAVHGAVTGALTRPEERPVPPEAIPKVNQAAPLGEEPVTPPPTTGPAGGAVHGASQETMASGGEETEARPTVNEPVEPVIHPNDQEPAPDVSHAHLDLNTLADMSDLPDEQARRDALAAMRWENPSVQQTGAAEEPAPPTHDPELLKSYRTESDEDLAGAYASSKDPVARQVLQERYPDNRFPLGVQDILHPDLAAKRAKAIADAGAVSEQAARQETAQQAQAPEGAEHLLQAIVKNGGLPNPARLKTLADKGEVLTGEMARLHDAWKALPLDAKKSLGSDGVTFNKLFSRSADPLDITRGNLAQHPDGYAYGTSGEMLDEVEKALSLAAQGRRVYGGGGIDYTGGGEFGEKTGRTAREDAGASVDQRGRARADASEFGARGDLGRDRQLYDVPQGWGEISGKPAIDWTKSHNAEHLRRANQVREEIRPAVEAIGAQLTADRGRNYARLNDDGFRVNLDPEKLAGDSIEDRLTHEQSLERMRSVADEELIHAADLLTQRREWEGSDPATLKSFYEHLLEQGRQAVKELFGAYDTGNREQKKFLHDTVEAAYNAYYFRDKGTRQVKFDEIRQRLEANPKAALDMRGEFVRQLIQAQRSGNISELVPRTLLGRLTNWLQKTITTLRAAYARVRGGEAGATMARVLRKTQAELDALGSIWRGKPIGEGGEFSERPSEPSDFALEIQKARVARKLKPEIERGKPAEFRFDQPEGFRLEQETTGGAPVPEAPKPATGAQGTFAFGERPEEPKLAEDKIDALNSSTFKPMDGRRRSWETFVGLLKGFHSMVPEAGAKGAGEGTLKIQQWERYLKGIGSKVKTDSANTVRKVLDPVLKVSSETHPALIDNLAKLNEQIKGRESAGKPVPPKWIEQRDKLKAIQNSNPLHLFQQAVLYRDLYFRSQVRVGTDVYGNPRYMELPMGLTKDEVINKLIDLKQRIRMLTPEQQAGVKDSLRSHYRLVRDIKDELANRGFVIPKELTNPYYYPHLLLEHMSGHLGAPRINTQEDFRNYLINPVGSEKPIETNYVKAMLQHLVEVRSHNARADATEQYLDSIDKSAKYKREVVMENNRRIDATGDMKNLLPQNAWERRARADGLEIYAAQKRLPLRMEAMLDLKAISKRIGHNIEGPNIATQLRKLGVQITADDVKTAMSTTDPIKWALHPKEVEALEGIMGRQKLASAAGHGWGNRFMNAQQKVLQAWKWWHLFGPTSAVRYNYNLMAVDLEKAATVDPAMLKKLGPAFKEVRELMKTGKYTSPEMESAVEHDVVHSPTAHELGQAHHFPQLHDLVQQPHPVARLFGNVAQAGAHVAGMRDRTFRYAKYLADLERLKAGQSVPEVALHRDLEAQPTLEARAAQNAREMFVDYGAISPAGQSLRKNLIPFYSYLEGNFRYHANLFRNFSDMSVPNKKEFIGKMAPRYAAKMLFGRATRGFLMRVAMVNGSIAAWNAWQMQQNKIKDSDLSDEDKRHLFIITGKDQNTGKVHVVYVPTATSDVASWLGGSHFSKAFGEYMQDHNLGKAVQHWMLGDRAGIGGAAGDIINKVASSVRPEILRTVGGLSRQNFFPNVMKPKPIPSYDTRHQLLSQIFDQPTADTVESIINNKFLPSKNLGDNLSQIILQNRYRDPQQENYYAARDSVDKFLEEKGKDRTPGTSNNEQTQVVRNLRMSMYNGDVPNALKFAQILVNEYGYNSQKFAATLKAQNPLSALPSALKKEYIRQLSDFDIEQLQDANRYVARLQTGAPNVQAEARAIFGPANKPKLNQQALQAAILAMQDQTKREATAQQLMQRSMAMRGR